MNNETGKAALYVLTFVLIVIIGGFAMDERNKKDHFTINDWASENNYRVVSVEKCFFSKGPFIFVDENDRVYKVEMADSKEHKRTNWFWFGVFNYEQKWD
jgi:hypothetical protein